MRWITIVLCAAGAVSMFGAASANASGHCGVASTRHHGSARIVQVRGNVSCATARRIIRDTLNGTGRWHQGQYAYQSYLAVRGGWKCGIATGYAGCSKPSMYVQAGPIRASAARFDYVDCGSNGGGLEFDIHSVGVSCRAARRIASRWFGSADGSVPGWRCRAGRPHNFGHATCTASGHRKVGFHYLVAE